MARKPTSKPTGARLPADWLPTTAPITLMLSKVPQDQYTAVIAAFEAHNRGRLSDDWPRDFKAWCRAELIRRGTRVQEPLW